MKWCGWLLFGLSSLLFFLSGSVNGGWGKSTDDLTEKDNGKVVTVVRNANKDTWVGVKLPLTGSLLDGWALVRNNNEVLHVEYAVNGHQGFWMGMKAVGKGISELELQYHGPDRDDAPATKTFKVTLRVD